MSIQHSPHRSRRATEQVDELHFPISDRRDLQQRAFEIALQLAPDGVKLHADIADPVAAGIAHPRWIAKVRCGSNSAVRAHSRHVRSCPMTGLCPVLTTFSGMCRYVAVETSGGDFRALCISL